MVDDAVFARVVMENSTVSGVLRALGLATSGGRNYQRVRDRVQDLGLCTDHWVGHRRGSGRLGPRTKRSFVDLLVAKAPRSTSTSFIKRKIMKAGLLPEVCSICGLGPVWQGQPLVLALDHINGDHRDFRLENLRLLCPNCHSQTPTFAGRRHRTSTVVCSSCGGYKATSSGVCRTCRAKQRSARPLVSELSVLLDQHPSLASIGRLFGVTATTVRRWAQELGISSERFPRRYHRHR